MDRTSIQNKIKIYFHADDYGITKTQTDAILACHEQGVLNSVSVMPNTDYLSEALYRLEGTGIRKVCHLNFIEGKSLVASEKCPLLVDDEGLFRCSFGYLLKLHFSSKGKRLSLKNQLKREIAAQIAAVFPEESVISVDSHQHFLLLPEVFEAFIEVVSEQHYTLSEIRMPVDPLSPFLTTPSIWKHFRLIDGVKWCVLSFLSIGKRRKLLQLGASIPVFFGIFFTCHMEYDIVSRLLPKYQRLASKKACSLELMFHPGGIYESNSLLDPSNQDLVQFYQSTNRKLEADALMHL